MKRRVVIVGGGMGGLTAALRLARRGLDVEIVEARAEVGGLACGVDVENFSFDAGPYILLDRPGLGWAFEALGLDLEALDLQPVAEVYEVTAEDTPPVRFYADLDRTAEGFEQVWRGAATRYRDFVARTTRVYRRLQPMLFGRPGPLRALRTGAFLELPFVLRSLHDILKASGLPQPIVDAIAIWTHVAGQRLENAPSPLAFVPSLIHSSGCWVPRGGIRAIPRLLRAACERAGVTIRNGARVVAIDCANGRARAVRLADGGEVLADAVLSNCGGPATYLGLIAETRGRTEVERLPLQSPGVCAYLAVRGDPRPPYLHFRLRKNELCRLLILPGVIDRDCARDGLWPARLISPMRHAEAEQMDAAAQTAHLEQLLAEDWWREGLGEIRVLARRTPLDWGAEYHLWRDSMNPVMTAEFMRHGRMAHRSPLMQGLYLSGSSTHPGQWVSFCAISGVLAADCVLEDFS